MEMIYSALALVLILGTLAVGGTIASAPLGAIAIWRFAKTRKGLHLKALLVSLLNGTGQAIALGLGAGAVGASVPDESAGEAALLMAAMGFGTGAITGFVTSYLLVFLGCKVVGRKAKQSPAQ